MGEAVVIGPRSGGGAYWFAFATESSGYEPNPTLFPEVDGGGAPTYWDFLQLECLADETTDALAKQIEALIKAQPDWNAREYGAVIYMVGNEIKMGPLISGMTVAEARAAGLSAPETRLPPPADLGDGVIWPWSIVTPISVTTTTKTWKTATRRTVRTPATIMRSSD